MNNTDNTKWVDFKSLEKFMTDVLIKAGVPKDDAATCAEVLITADKMGIDSHGINRLKPIYYDRIIDGIMEPITKIDIVREAPATAVLNGNNGMGMVIAKKSMEMAIDKAEKYGIGMVSVKNSTHYGIAGYYPLMATKKNMIGITGTNARPSIAPTFGVENMLGTNPLTFALPSDEDFPFMLDCATSVSQRGKIEVYARKGKDIPKGWVLGQDGQSLTNSQEVLDALKAGAAALIPLGGAGEETGGYKGYGYATLVEILSSALQGGKFLKMLSGMENGKKTPIRLGHFFIAINISSFIETSEFKKITGDILRQLRSSKKMPGQERIYTAGEKEYLTSIERLAKGAPLNEKLQDEIKSLIYSLGLDDYGFNL